jgi:hypothetical protein
MTDLTKKESAYFIITSIIAMSVLVATLWLWANQQPSCWELYANEAQAIEACEQ